MFDQDDTPSETRRKNTGPQQRKPQKHVIEKGFDFETLLGQAVVFMDPHGKHTVNPRDAVVGKKVLGLFFAGNSSQEFTAKLAIFYSKMQVARTGLEVVFVSKDLDEDQFESCLRDQPWLALPLSQQEVAQKLFEKFDVSETPKLVLLSTVDGLTLTNDGHGRVLDDPEGTGFPWVDGLPPIKPILRLPSTNCFDLLLGPSLIFTDPHGKHSVSTSEVVGGKNVIGLYFSDKAHQHFTPQFSVFYSKMQVARKGLEVVFISEDKCEEDFLDHLKSMPWLALPFEAGAGAPKTPGGRALRERFGVRVLPTLVLLDANDGQTLTVEEGLGRVIEDPEGLHFPWTG